MHEPEERAEEKEDRRYGDGAEAEDRAPRKHLSERYGSER